jgi:predicted MFS family arabinose efflux permease
MKLNKLYYGWVVVAVTVIALILAAGARSAPGVFVLPIQENFPDWKRAAISLAISIGLVMYGFGGPLSGWLMNKFGPRRIVFGGLLITALSMTLSAGIQQLWQLNLLFGFLSGVGTGIVGSVLGATVANRWFLKQRGLIVGIFGAATSAGQLIFYPLLQHLVDVMGWRTTSIWIAAITAVLAIPIVLLMRNQPSDVNEKPYGADDNYVPSKQTTDANVMSKALRSLDFWLLAVTFFVCGATSNGLIGVHFIAHAVEHGFAKDVAASTLAFMGVFNFVGTIASGWLTDRYNPRLLLATYYTLRGVSLLFLPLIHDQLGMSAFAILFGLDYIATVPPTVALTADTFGRRNVGVVYGWIFCAHQIGAASAAWLGGVVRDSYGSYNAAFVVGGGVAIAGGILALGIRRMKQVVPAS